MTTPNAPPPALHSQPDGMRRWQRDLEDARGNEIRVEVEAYFDLGEQTLAFDTLYGRKRESGAEVALPGAGVTRWREGRCVHVKAYADRGEALRDSVCQEAIKRIDP